MHSGANTRAGTRFAFDVQLNLRGDHDGDRTDLDVDARQIDWVGQERRFGKLAGPLRAVRGFQARACGHGTREARGGDAELPPVPVRAEVRARAQADAAGETNLSPVLAADRLSNALVERAGRLSLAVTCRRGQCRIKGSLRYRVNQTDRMSLNDCVSRLIVHGVRASEEPKWCRRPDAGRDNVADFHVLVAPQAHLPCRPGRRDGFHAPRLDHPDGQLYLYGAHTGTGGEVVAAKYGHPQNETPGCALGDTQGQRKRRPMRCQTPLRTRNPPSGSLLLQSDSDRAR